MDSRTPIFIKAANHTSASLPAVAGPKIIKDVLVHEKKD
jgi:hypothetical protein